MTTTSYTPALSLSVTLTVTVLSSLTSSLTGYVVPLTLTTKYSLFAPSGNVIVITASPVLPAPTLVQDCYRQMFYGSTKLNTVTCLATSGINTNNSTNSWLTGASSRGTFSRAKDVSWPTGNNGRKSWTLVDYTS